MFPVCQYFRSENPGANFCIFNFEIAVQYLPEFGCPRRKKCFSGVITSLGSRETSLESPLKVLGSKIIFYLFILSLVRKLVLSFLTRIAFLTRSKVVSRKVLNGLKRKRSLWKALSKRQTVRIILPLTLRNARRKSRRKVFAYLINCQN